MTTNERPKPAPPKPKQAEAPTPPPATPAKDKPKFVRKPHLTARPFVGHEGLENLKKALEQPLPNKQYPKPGRRRTNKEKK